jgi:hypothetical protein
MGGVNVAIEVGKYRLQVAVGSSGELMELENQPRAVTALAQRLAELTCARVLIEGGSYQNSAGRSVARGTVTGSDY